MGELIRWSRAEVERVVHAPTDADDKYSRGVLGVRTGSDRYPGAAVLGVDAAWRTGLGMVRYVGPPRASDFVLRRRPETVTADGRVQAWLIGSGTDAEHRDDDETSALRDILAGDHPVVVDAGALDLAPAAAAPVIVTPHAKEHAKLRKALGLDEADEKTEGGRVAAARETAKALGGCVLLKGAVTIVAAPDGWSARVQAGTPWLATAGTGDVLGGVLGALVAAAAARGALDLRDLATLAASAAWLHGRAGAQAVHDAAGGPVTALEVAEALPRTVGQLLTHR